LDITVHNPHKVCSGVVEMRVDGEAHPGSTVPADLAEGRHRVEVWLGP
jgi:hypothetical protein